MTKDRNENTMKKPLKTVILPFGLLTLIWILLVLWKS